MPLVVSSLPARFSHVAALWRTSWHISRRTLKIGLLTSLWSLLAAWWVMGAGFLVLRYGILPNVNDYRPKIEQQISQALGLTVRIGEVQADWRGLRPELRLSTIRLYNRSGQLALEVPRAEASLSWLSVPLFAPRFASLQMVSPELEVVRLPDQRWRIGGIEFDTRGASDPRFAQWILNQREIVVRGALIRYRDEVRHTPLLELRDTTLLLQNTGRRHRAALLARPPEALAAQLDVRADFTHRFFSRNTADWREWQGSAYANFDYADLAALNIYVPLRQVLNADIREAKGALRAWVAFDSGRLEGSTADVALQNVRVVLDSTLPELHLQQVRGRLHAAQLADARGTGHQMRVEGLSFSTPEGLHVPPTDLSEELLFDAQGHIVSGALSASALDLTTLLRMADYVPLPAPYRAWLTRYAPRGNVRELRTEWHGPVAAPQRYALSAKFSELALKPQTPDPNKAPTHPHHHNFGLPGFENLRGQITLNERTGELKIDSSNTVLFFPGVFARERIALDRLAVQAEWQHQANGLNVEIAQLAVANSDAAGVFKGRYQPGGKRGIADFEGQLTRVDARTVHHYLPLTVPETTRRWVQQAVLAGGSNDVRFRLQGDLYDWPYHQTGNGVFVIHAKLNNTQLKIAPDWPTLTDVRGDLIFEKNGFRVENSTANSDGVRINNIKVSMADFSEPSHTLNLRGTLQGPVKNYFDFIRNSPVGAWLGHALDDARGSGEARAEIDAQLPLQNIAISKVRGNVVFGGNDLNLVPGLPSFARTTGRLEFSESGAALRNISTLFLGGTLRLDSPASSTFKGFQARGDGGLNVAVMSRALGLEVLQRSSGNTRYSVQFNTNAGSLEWGVQSDLTGVQLNLPAPLRKATTEALPLRLQTKVLPDGHQEWRFHLGQQVSAVLERESTTTGTARVLRGSFHMADNAVAAIPTLPADGLNFQMRLRQLDLDAWNALLDAGDNSTATTSDVLGWRWPSVSIINLQADEVQLANRRFKTIQAQATWRDFGWFVNIDSPQVRGNLAWRKGSATTPAGRAVGRFSRLALPAGQTNDVAALLDAAPAQDIPALNIEIEEFELGNKAMGKLELLANNIGRGDTREWQLQKLSIRHPDSVFSATGSWARESATTRRMTLHFNLNTDNAGVTLERLGVKNALRNGASKLDGQVQWRGSPFNIDFPSLNGQLSLVSEKGQFLKADPGVGRLIGVLSLQSIPKRLSLDFRDVFSEGFAFDSIRATVQLRNGIASTQDFKMRGLNATVFIEGDADLARETQNLRVLVLPEINAGAASVVYGLLANPAIGLGTFLAQLVLREPLAKVFSYEYRVTGPWADPRVERINSKTESSKTDAAEPGKGTTP